MRTFGEKDGAQNSFPYAHQRRTQDLMCERKTNLGKKKKEKLTMMMTVVVTATDQIYC